MTDAVIFFSFFFATAPLLLEKRIDGARSPHAMCFVRKWGISPVCLVPWLEIALELFSTHKQSANMPQEMCVFFFDQDCLV